MTRLYTPTPIDGYDLCHPTSPADFETFNRTINGELRHQFWRSPSMQLVQQDRGRALLASDSPWLGSHALVFRSPLDARIHRILMAHGELLPLECRDADLVVYNPTRVIDALDEDCSSVARFADGKIMMVRRYAFRWDLLRGVEIFKIPNLRVSPTFVSQEFVDGWKLSRRVGLGFRHAATFPSPS